MSADKLFLSEIFLEQAVTIANPGAGNEVSYPGYGDGWRARVMHMGFTLTTSATVADRRVQVVIRRGTRDFIVSVAEVVQTASLAVRYTVTPGGVASTAIIDNRILMRWPYPPEVWSDATVNVGYTFLTDTVNLQAGDAFTDPDFLFRAALT